MSSSHKARYESSFKLSWYLNLNIVMIQHVSTESKKSRVESPVEIKIFSLQILQSKPQNKKYII